MGIGVSTRVRKTYSTAARQTASGALKLVADMAEVPVKSTVALRPSRSIVTLTRISLPSSKPISALPSASRAITRRTASSALSWTWPI